MPGETFIRTDDLALRTVEEEDAELFARLAADPHQRQPRQFATPKATAEAEEYYEEEVADDDSLHLLACEGDRVVALVALLDLHPQEGHAELAVWVPPEARGEGYAEAAVRPLLDHAFEQLRLHRVDVVVRADDDEATARWESLGFTAEGTFRRSAFVDGEFVDERVYGLLAREWPDGSDE